MELPCDSATPADATIEFAIVEVDEGAPWYKGGRSKLASQLLRQLKSSGRDKLLNG